MSETSVEPITPPKIAENVVSPPRARRRWLRRILILLVLLWAAGQGISLTLQHTRLRRLLTAQIEAATGRPVEVGSFAFILWGGPAIEARSVTVSEDPRFGSEYFLRADSMSVHLRWRSLLRGRLDFGTLSLDRPSLNLVRNSFGDWNLAQWLPEPHVASATQSILGPVLPSMATHFRRIEVEGGRINFKIGDEKIPFAFIDVSGAVESNGSGRWRLNLEAVPWRAAVALQSVGKLRVSGDVGGTSSRLRPASLNLNWTDASLSDVIRLARRDDFGVRGSLSLVIDARTQAVGDAWIVQGRSELREIHRWDLVSRPDNPSLNLTALLAWRASTPYIDVTRALLEAPHSSAEATGRLSWSPEALPAKRTVPLEPTVESSAVIDASDLLAWARAFHPGVAANLPVRGILHSRASFAGWPPRVTGTTVSSEGFDFTVAPSRKLVRLGRLQFRYENGRISFAPVNVSWGPAAGAPEGSFRLVPVSVQGSAAVPAWRIAGSARQVRDVIAGAAALGWNIPSGWDISGPAACDLRWSGGIGQHLGESLPHPLGWIEFGAKSQASDGAVLRVPFLNLPIDHINARVELISGDRTVQLASAQVFGARWHGTLERRDSAAPWMFSLSADQLATTDLDRWLNPRWRESFLDRMLPFLNSRAGASAAPDGIHATGRLSVERFTLAPLTVSHVQGNLDINGRRITLTNAVGQFYGGNVDGSVEAILRSTPSYHADLDFSHVDVPAITSASSNLSELLAGTASGQISFESHGASRSDLLGSLSCHGEAEVLSPRLRTISLSESLQEGLLRPGADQFASANATIMCSHRLIELHQLHLVAVDTGIEGSGTVDFGGNLDLKLQRYSVRAPIVPNAVSMTGPLTAPQVTRLVAAPPRRAR